MSSKSFMFDDAFYDYLLAKWVREPEILQRLREETAQMPNAMMQISSEQGQFMAMLAKLLGVRRYLEVGVFTGYSSLAMALAMPADATIVACDVSEEFTAVARRYWEDAGVYDRIDLRLAPAAETLAALEPGFDLMFIDADKASYATYFEQGMRLVRSGGVILIDNVFWSGAVAKPEVSDPDTDAIRDLNTKLHADQRIDLAVLPIGDGLTMARKR